MATHARWRMQDKALVVAIAISTGCISTGECARLKEMRLAKVAAVSNRRDSNKVIGLDNSTEYIDEYKKQMTGSTTTITTTAMLQFPFCSPSHDPPNRRVLWYGGTFDPPTVAHMHTAEVGLAQEEVDCVWFSPLYHPLYKPEKSDIRLRERMLLESFGEDSESMAVVQAFELSYKDGNLVQRMQIQAYHYLVATYQHTKFDMVVGADAVTPQGSYTVEGWRDILRAISHDGNQIFVMDRDVQGANIREYEEMLVTTWNVSPNPYVNIVVDMDRYSHVSSSGIRKLLLDARDGEIDESLREALSGAGLSDVLVEFLQKHPEVVEQYNRRTTTTTRA